MNIEQLETDIKKEVRDNKPNEEMINNPHNISYEEMKIKSQEQKEEKKERERIKRI